MAPSHCVVRRWTWPAETLEILGVSSFREAGSDTADNGRRARTELCRLLYSYRLTRFSSSMSIRKGRAILRREGRRTSYVDAIVSEMLSQLPRPEESAKSTGELLFSGEAVDVRGEDGSMSNGLLATAWSIQHDIEER
ncbi:hypothetical protein CCMA1212_005458 [Trichoderma ghanense]|uniref:Uncharacterized protein n=1 Tax=Trichoderma ghanense TaxID=65468 RepID=A0ABY2H669_9HYPO